MLLLLARMACSQSEAPAGAGTSRPFAPVAFKTAGQGEFTFDTGVLRGKLRADGRSIGLSSVVHVPSGIKLDRSMGLLSHYRVFTTGRRYGNGAWDWPSTATLRMDGAVEVRWPAGDERPFELSAIYRWHDPQTLDLETAVTATRDLAGFESFLASYFNSAFTNSLVFVDGAAAGGASGFSAAELRFGHWQMFPRDTASVALIQDGRWKLAPSPVDWTIRPSFARALGVRRDPVSGLTAVLMAPTADCFALSTPFESEGHYSLYLSLFGRDIKAGRTERARARLVITNGISEEQMVALHEAYLKTAGEAASRPVAWEPVGLSGGGAMFTPAISPADPNLMMVNCDMSAAYLSEDGGRNWRMIHHAQLHSDIGCRAAFHPTDTNAIYASSGGRLRVSRDRGETFTPLGNLRESLQGELAINPADPKVLLAGTRGGRCWLSRDAGVTWSACQGPRGRAIGFHFDQTRGGRVFFAATAEGIWRSDDAGETWREATGGLPWKELQGFAAGSDAASGVVMLYCSIRSRATNGAFAGGIYRSAHRGASWQPAMGPGLNTDTKKADRWGYADLAQYHQLLATDTKPLTVYAVNSSTGFHPPHHETVYRSDDGGATWRATYFQDPRFERCNVEPDYVNASTGQSFKGGNPPFGAAICNRDPERVLLAMNEAHATHDGGVTWLNGSARPASPGKPKAGSAWRCNGLVVTTTWNYYIDPFEPNRHYIAYTDIGFARSLDAGRTWIWWDKNSWAPWRNTCYEIAFDPDTPGKMWGAFSDTHDIPNDNIISGRHRATYPGGVCVSHDFGASWKVEATGLPAKAVTSVVVDPRSPKGRRTLYTGVFDEGVFQSTDDGKAWTLRKEGLGAPENLRVSRVFLHSDGTLFAMICAKRPGPGQPLLREGVGLYRSTNAAQTWEKVNASQLLLYPKDFSVDPRESRRIVIGACDAGGGDPSGGLYHTADGGLTWQRIGREGPQTFGGYFHPKHRDWIYMTLTEGAPRAGLWLSRDRGRTWEPFNDLPFANIQRVHFNPANDATLFVTTFGGSVWRGPTAPVW